MDRFNDDASPSEDHSEDAHLPGEVEECTALESRKSGPIPQQDVEMDTEEDSDSEMSESGSSSEVDLDVESRRTQELGIWARQAKVVRSELQRTQDSDTESGDMEGANKDVLGWGSREKYYGTDEYDKQDEDRKEGIEATLELQRADLEQLDNADFDLPSKTAAKQKGIATSDETTTDVDANDKESLSTLYSDLKQNLNEVRFKIGPLLAEAKKGDLCTAEGLTYLAVKHLLLLHYCICIVFYILMKLEGASVKDHPVLLRLIEIRGYLEKLRPIEARLQPQVDKLLRAIVLAKNDEGLSAQSTTNENFSVDSTVPNDDEDRLAPHPEDLVPKVQEGADVYRPPKMNPVSMDDENPKRKRGGPSKKKKEVEDAMVKEIIEEMTGAPEEVSSGGNPLERMKSILAERMATDLSAQEEDAYSRQSNAGKEKKKRSKQLGMFGGVSFEDFTEDIQNTVDAIKASNSMQLLPVHAPSTVFPSGDADLPFREPKQRPLETASKTTDSDSEEEGRKRKKSSKAAKLHHSLPPKAPKTTTGRRGISAMIQRNRGLTPHRRKDRKNPRSRHRGQYENKEKRRKGQSQQSHASAPDHYGGESSGISKRVKKSVSFS